MVECFRCGISMDKEALIDVISGEGIKKICKNCLYKENLPIIKKAKFEQEKPQTVYERLSRVAGINPKEMRTRKSDELRKQEESLRSLVDKNYRKNIQEVQSQDENLVRNFHWIMIRVRRLKKLTQKQLAEAILEPEAAIKMVEQGILPKEWGRLIRKIENYLGINLIKRDNENLQPIRRYELESKEVISQPLQFPKEETKKTKIDFSSLDTKDIMIGDLKEIKKQKEGFFRKLFRGERSEKENSDLEEKTEEKSEEEKTSEDS